MFIMVSAIDKDKGINYLANPCIPFLAIQKRMMIYFLLMQ